MPQTDPVRIQLVIDCARPSRLAAFWATALHWEPEPPPHRFASWREYWRGIGVPEDELDPDDDGNDSIVDPSGRAPRIWFQQVPESKAGKNRLHLDLLVGGGRSVPLAERRAAVDAEVARLQVAGAQILHLHAPTEMEHYAVTMGDPEGNEFCIV